MATTSERESNRGSVLPEMRQPVASEPLDLIPLLDWDVWEMLTKPEKHLTIFSQLQLLTRGYNELVERENRRQQLQQMREG